MNAQTHSAEQRLLNLGIALPSAPQPLGAYVETVEVGKLLFLSGMLPIIDGVPKFFGRVGAELDLAQGSIGFIRRRCLNKLRERLEKMER